MEKLCPEFPSPPSYDFFETPPLIKTNDPHRAPPPPPPPLKNEAPSN